jgi:hypothetical protein
LRRIRPYLAVYAFSLFGMVAGPAAAQTPPPDTSAPSRALLPHVAVLFSWARMITSDPRFQWDARVRIDFDVAEVNEWQMRFIADYDAVLGRERRPFDLNQGFYLLEGTIGHKVHSTDVALVARHVSRHLVDRENTPSISWNFVGVRASHGLVAGGTTLDGDFELGHAMQQAFVDYTWMTKALVRATRPLNSTFSLVGGGLGEINFVNHLVRDRRVCGGRVEGGLRVNGRAANFDLIVGYERRIDGYPIERSRVRAFTVGFRLVSR